MGLQLSAEEIDGTSGGSSGGSAYSDTMVSVGPAGRGGTGSFISPEGLIITNHHVALDAVRQASTPQNDYLRDGFVARTKEEEIAGPDYEVWITKACLDVSDRMLRVVEAEPDALTRANKVQAEKELIAAEHEKELSGSDSRCEVREMFADKSYVLFTFFRLRDVRIVYVPPMSLGNFGGDTDNFEWPRHSADFTLLRAYVAPDGSSSEPSETNIPYKPTKCLRASQEGASDGDFVFLLGFPGRTMRYAPSSRLAYADQVAVPELLSDFSYKLSLIQDYASDRSVMLKLMSAKKSLSNEYKRSKGKRVMMRKLKLLDERRSEEKALNETLPEAKALLDRLSQIYDELSQGAEVSEALERLRGIYHGSVLFAVGHALHEASVEASKPDAERESPYKLKNQAYTLQRLKKRLKDLHPPNEARLAHHAIQRAASAALLPKECPSAAEVEALVSSTCLRGVGFDLESILKGDSPPPLEDKFVKISRSLYPIFVKTRDAQKALLSERDQLLASLLELQKMNTKEAFYPDANSSLRISAGFVEGYQVN